MTFINNHSENRNPPPARIEGFKSQEFISWLAQGGALIGLPTNRYEVLRYRSYPSGATKLMTSIVYRKENGELTWTGASFKHYEKFVNDEPMTGQARGLALKKPKIVPVISKKERTRARIIERDGSDCWFCGKALGVDITIEHLVPKSKGGENSEANYALAHSACNSAAANMPLIAKIELRHRMRKVVAE